MAVTIDPRPTYFGDRMIVTGSYDAGEASVDLSGLLASIDGAIVNPTAAQLVKHQDVDIAGGTSYAAVDNSIMDAITFSGTTITIAPAFVGQTTTGGTFVVIGRRS